MTCHHNNSFLVSEGTSRTVSPLDTSGCPRAGEPPSSTTSTCESRLSRAAQAALALPMANRATKPTGSKVMMVFSSERIGSWILVIVGSPSQASFAICPFQ